MSDLDHIASTSQPELLQEVNAPEETTKTELNAKCPAQINDDDKDPEELVRFGISMPASLVRELDAWRKQHGYGSRSEAVRDLVRDTLITQQWEDSDPDAEMVGVVTIVYRHTTRELSEHLTQMQHHHHHISQAALHVHLNSDNCLETIVLRGKQSEVVDLAHHLISARGVLHGKFIPTTTGEEVT